MLIFDKIFFYEKNFCTFYLVRHGETDWNTEGLVQGHSDIPLNKNGEFQAYNLGKKLKDIHFDAVFSSDLLRAKRTAEIIAQEKKLLVKTTRFLRERAFGKLEGKPSLWLIAWRKAIKKGISFLTDEERKVLIKEDPEIERDSALMSRFLTFVREIAVAYAGKNVLLVSHGGLMRVFLVKVGYFKDEDESYLYSITNAGYIVFQSDGSEFFIKEVVGIEKVNNF